jgi:hypothetical protein
VSGVGRVHALVARHADVTRLQEEH